MRLLSRLESVVECPMMAARRREAASFTQEPTILRIVWQELVIKADGMIDTVELHHTD